VKHKDTPEDLFLKPSRAFKHLPGTVVQKDRKKEAKKYFLDEDDLDWEAGE
jgi:hypothetical protein